MRMKITWLIQFRFKKESDILKLIANRIVTNDNTECITLNN